MTQEKWWGAPEHITKNGVALTSRLDALFAKGCETIKNTQPLTVRIRGVMIREDLDRDWLRKDDNDLIIVTTSQFDTEPPVQRLHFMNNNVALGWQGDFFNDTVLAIKAFNEEKRRLTLRIQIYDVDKIETGFVDAIVSSAKSVAVAFPNLAPYVAATSFVLPSFSKLVENFSNHDQILDERLTLELSEVNSGRKLLQPGYFVYFSTPQEDGLFLEHTLKVCHKNDDADNEFKDCSYAVLGIERDMKESREWEIDQKTSKLIAQLQGKGESGQASIEFLRETLDGYDKFKQLQRAKELQSKKKRTPDEENFLATLAKDEDLVAFLPNTKGE
ncbi:MAG: hypothetical protein IPJ94_26740 [Chloroflexi bacterium]|nr:hypothetical protein [Chloroflexota bacterium]